MRLWDYFEEEARKSKISGGEEERNLEATHCLLHSWVWYSFCHVGTSE